MNKWRVISSAKVVQDTGDPCRTGILVDGKVYPMANRLFDLENDLWYTRSKTIGPFTQDDFKWTDKSHGNGYGYISMPLETAASKYVMTFAADGAYQEELSGDVASDRQAEFVAWEDGVLYIGVGAVCFTPDFTITIELQVEESKKVPIEFCDTTEIEQALEETEQWVNEL